jgi:hypothetical protein
MYKRWWHLYKRWKCGLQAGQVFSGMRVRRNGFKSLRARGKLEAVRDWAIGEQPSRSDAKKWALEYIWGTNMTQ